MYAVAHTQERETTSFSKGEKNPGIQPSMKEGKSLSLEDAGNMWPGTTYPGNTCVSYTPDFVITKQQPVSASRLLDILGFLWILGSKFEWP